MSTAPIFAFFLKKQYVSIAYPKGMWYSIGYDTPGGVYYGNYIITAEFFCIVTGY